MTLEELINLCKSYTSLGWAIQEQLDSVIEDDMTEDNINENALGYIEGWLQDVDGLIGENLDPYFERMEEFKYDTKTAVS